MKKLFMQFIFLLVSSLFFLGCSPSSNLMNKVPEWTLDPEIEGGIAVSECVESSDDFSRDKEEAVALARASLAKQIKSRVETMDKTYKRKIGSEKTQSNGSVFEAVSEQVTNRYVKGAQIRKVDQVSYNNIKHLCVKCGLDPKATERLFASLVEQSEVDLTTEEKRILYEKFQTQE